MLCQLVCVDRRYQRMNCFNIREVQSLLKRRYFTDLINTKDHRTLLSQTSIGIRFKTSNVNLYNGNTLNFYNFGTEKNPKTRIFKFLNIKKSTQIPSSRIFIEWVSCFLTNIGLNADCIRINQHTNLRQKLTSFKENNIDNHINELNKISSETQQLERLNYHRIRSPKTKPK